MGEKDPSRRASDDTRQRIDNLAGGWDMPAREPDPEDDKPKPPPPPPARAAAAPRPSPPPPPAPRKARATAPPTPPAPIVIGHESFDDTRDDATRIDPVRGDATLLGGVARAAPAATSGTLRAPSTFRKRRGLSGDVLYVFTVLFGGAAARRQLARLEAAIEQSRLLCEQRMIALGADGIADPSLDDDRLAAARDALGALEEERSAKAGQAAAAEAEVDSIQRNERGEVDKQTAEVKAIEAELASVVARLVPLDKEVSALRRRGNELRTTLGRIDDQIRDAEGKAVSARGGKGDRAAVEAELATLRADRLAVGKDEPALAAQQDELEPRIAALLAERNRANRRLADARAAITAAAERATDERAAVQAARRVIDRGLGDLEKRRDRALGRLGEHLAMHRPIGLDVPLAALDEAELACVSDERRAMELREMLSSVDRGAVARGVAILVLVVAAVGAFGYFLATR